MGDKSRPTLCSGCDAMYTGYLKANIDPKYPCVVEGDINSLLDTDSIGPTTGKPQSYAILLESAAKSGCPGLFDKLLVNLENFPLKDEVMQELISRNPGILEGDVTQRLEKSDFKLEG